MKRDVMFLCLIFSLLSGFPSWSQVENCFDFSGYDSCPPGGGICFFDPIPDDEFPCAQDCYTCTANVDDDGDCSIDEEVLDGIDNDKDGLIDEDISCLNTCESLGYACPPEDVQESDLLAPLPVLHPLPGDDPLKLPAKLVRWGCPTCPPPQTPLADATLNLDMEMMPDPDAENPRCGVYHIIVRLKERGTGTVYFEGPAVAVYTRSWESLEPKLITGSVGSIQIFRYTFRTDLERVVDYSALPDALRIPCSEDEGVRPHLFFYGHIDVARDSGLPDTPDARRTAIVFGHPPGRMSHPETIGPGDPHCNSDHVSARPIDRCDPEAHDENGWFLVAPGDNFIVDTSVAVPSEPALHGNIRNVPDSPGKSCRQSTRVCESDFQDLVPPWHCDDMVLRRVKFCGEDDAGTDCSHYNINSKTACDTIPNDRVAFTPLGYWDEVEFPANMEVSLFEGDLVCSGLFNAYWYGSFSTEDSSAYVHTSNPADPFWLGPEMALDVIDNYYIQLDISALRLIGSVNWLWEGSPDEIFAPLDVRTMYLFPHQNPDIPEYTPCAASAIIDPDPPPTCPEDPCYFLSGAGSWVENCCQCGVLEYQWLKDTTIVREWSADPQWEVCPTEVTEYTLEVRCNHSKTHCTSSRTVTVYPPPPSADPVADPAAICIGGSSELDARASGTGDPAKLKCRWEPAGTLDDPDSCTPMATPTATTTYTVTVWYEDHPDPECKNTADVTVTVMELPVAVIADPLAGFPRCPGQMFELDGSGSTPDPGPGVTYAWGPDPTYYVSPTDGERADVRIDHSIEESSPWPGWYTFSLTVTNACGADTKEAIIKQRTCLTGHPAWIDTYDSEGSSKAIDIGPIMGESDSPDVAAIGGPDNSKIFVYYPPRSDMDPDVIFTQCNLEDVRIGDFDEDGWEDIVVIPFTSNGGTCGITVYPNHGVAVPDMIWGSPITTELSEATAIYTLLSFDSGDIDNDGHLDLAIRAKMRTLTNMENVILIYYGRGDGTFENPPFIYPADDDSDWDSAIAGMEETVVEDLLDGPGAEIATLTYLEQQVAVFVNDDALPRADKFPPADRYYHHLDGNPSSLITADFDADGDPDIAVAASVSVVPPNYGVVYLLENISRAAIDPPSEVFVTDADVMDLAAGHFGTFNWPGPCEQDDCLDLALSFCGVINPSAGIFLGRGDNTFADRDPHYLPEALTTVDIETAPWHTACGIASYELWTSGEHDVMSYFCIGRSSSKVIGRN
ncbi:FG-GAP-like repeat-containing protein [Acidobacteriota bacterium]